MFLRTLVIIITSLTVSANCAPDQDAAGSGVAEKLPAASEGSGTGSPHPASLALIERGETLYQRRCGACHSVDANRVGPKHRDVYGRLAGSVPDFRYSKALQELGVVWTEETLDEWLENPAAFAPGTSMGFRLSKPDERAAIIAYLKSVSAN